MIFKLIFYQNKEALVCEMKVNSFSTPREGETFIHIQGRKASKREQYTLTSFVVSPLDKHFLSLDPIGNGIFNEAFFFLVLFNNPLSELKKKCIKLYVSLCA